MSDTFYKKNEKGEFIPVTFNSVDVKDFKDKVVIVTIGSEENPAPYSEIDSFRSMLYDNFPTDDLDNTSFFIMSHQVEFEVLGKSDEIKNSCISVRVTENDDLTNWPNHHSRVPYKIIVPLLGAVILFSIFGFIYLKKRKR